MPPSPPASASSSVCDEVQLALVGGGELTDRDRVHLAACPECGFLAALSRAFASLVRPTRTEAAGLGPAFSATLDHALATGEPLLGRWRLVERLGRGGQGQVFRAVDLETDEPVAVKLVRAAAGAGGAAEVANARRVRHPNVCRVYHTERHGELRLIVMEWVDGPNLAERPPATRDEALRLFRGVCEGVRAAHDAGILHLDLKPANVLLREGAPVVTDFGLSARVPEGATVVASGGTPRYMAPEQQRGEPVDRRADVYALGRLLEAWLGERAGGAAGAAIRAATAESPGDRPADARALLALLDRPLERRRLVRRVLLGAAVVAAALGVASIAVPPPRGARVTWRPDLWGNDYVPATAWNVALNQDGRPLPAVEVEHPMWGCGQAPADLLDGVAHYPSWCHGVAFRPAPTSTQPEYACVPIEWVASGGEVSPDDRLCEFGDAGYRVVDERGRDLEKIPPERRANIGLAVPKAPCGERALTITLDRAYELFALRAWHYQGDNVPRLFRVQVWDEAGRFHETLVPQNAEALDASWYATSGEKIAYRSAPVTTLFAPVRARKVRLVMDTCTTLDDARLRAYRESLHRPDADPISPGHGWLYEVEVFARVSRVEAWRRSLFD